MVNDTRIDQSGVKLGSSMVKNKALNKTVNHGYSGQYMQKWAAQSEDGLIQRANLVNDSSFYSFRLQP